MGYSFGINEETKCLFCGQTIVKKSCTGTVFRREEYDCPRCGVYSLGSKYLLGNNTKFIQALYYYMLNVKTDNIDIVVISENDVSALEDEEGRRVRYISEVDILQYLPINFSQQVDMALLNFSKVYPEYDSKIQYRAGGIAKEIIDSLHVASKIKNMIFLDGVMTKEDYSALKKMRAFLELMVDMGYLFQENASSGILSYRISSKGWLRIQEMQKKANKNRQSFVAMWFDPQNDNAWSKISQAIRDCGYIPIRIDKKEHNNQIVPEILYEIRQSEFVVADLTGNRNGVYYEAGYAQALDKEVIVTWKKTDEKKEQPHFDVAQKNMIQWKNEDELYECLVKRIEATVGKR